MIKVQSHVTLVPHKIKIVQPNVRKNKKTTECEKSTVTCDFGKAQCENDTIKCEKR